MKIAILVSGLPPQHNGGAEIAALEIAKYAQRAGHTVHIVVIGRRSPLDDYPPRQFVPPAVRIWSAVETQRLRGLSCIPSIVRILRQIKPDIVHAQSLYMAPGAIAARLLLGIPYLLYERGGVEMKSGWNRVGYPIAMRLAHRVIAQTEYQKKSLLRHHHRAIEVIPNGVDQSKFKYPIGREEAREIARKVLGLPANRKIVLAVGRCRPEKNLMDFVKASRLVSEALFVLVGDGPELETLKREGPDVRFAGNVAPHRVPLYMDAADVLVNTSTSEGFPMAILEGMAAGLPIVAPDICGIPELITCRENGLLFQPTPPSSGPSAAAMITVILSSTPAIKRIAQNNIEKAKQYSWEKVVEKLYGRAV